MTEEHRSADSNDVPRNAVAIVGMAGCFPDAPDLTTFWRNLTDGVESLTPLTDDELRKAGVPPELIADPNYVKKATVLEGADRFDASFFGFNAREAEILDPQQRVFLECAWQAIEDAGYVPDRCPGAVGVFAGASINSYLYSNLLSNPAVLEAAGSYQVMISNDKDFLATRVSYKLNLHGPGITVQTACSTSLVAVQLAWQSLLNGQCDMALAGGVSIGFPQRSGYLYQEGMISSPDGHCRPFDARGQGIRGGSGAGIVVLKRLADAIADHDNIRAVILGAAINNDGAGKMGYTAPSLDGQAEAISMAHASANVDPGSISYIEAHGTATPLGDPIEVGALSQVFRAGTDKRNFCALGSVKSNIGHLDAAAGIAGLIKTALSLENATIPASLNFEQPNPQIDFDDSPFYVNASLAEWRSDGHPRRAGVSSFGIGGTNAHAVLEEAPQRPESVVTRPAQLLVLSARSHAALDQAASNLAAHLEAHPDLDLADVAYTLQVGRKSFDHRRAIVCHNTSDAVAALRRKSATSADNAVAARSPAVAFMFSGQGSQYGGMGRGLYETDPTFREELDRCAIALQPHLGSDIRDLILSAVATGDESELNQTRFAQPALFAFEYSVARTLMAWGVQPSAMIGHSIGEYVAACIAGVMSLDDALRLVVERGRLMQAMQPGRMLAIPLSEADVTPLLSAEVSLAAVNAPRLCVVAGSADAIANLERKLGAQGIECRALHTSHAFHSAMMDPAIPEFSRIAASVSMSEPQLPFVSNLTGTWAVAGDVTQADYWARHIRGTVRFADGLRELSGIAGLVLIEIGPGKTLATLARQTVGQSGITVISSGRHPLDVQADVDIMLDAVGQLWKAGINIDWQSFHRGESLYRTSLPSYPFERQRYLVEPRPVAIPNPPTLARNADITDWFYVPSFKRVPTAASSGNLLPKDGGAWLILVDNVGIGARIAERVVASGARCYTISQGDGFASKDQSYVVRPGVREDYDRVFTDLRARGVEIRQVVHGWSVTGPDWNEDVDVAADMGYISLVLLMQALEETRGVGKLAVTVLSSGIERVLGNEMLHPAKSLVLAPAMLLSQEFHDVICQSIDIDPAEATDQLVDELTLSAAMAFESGSFAYRLGSRWSRTFAPMPIGQHDGIPSRLRKAGVYLITGGLGALGLLVAEFLAETVGARLILTGRTALPAVTEWKQWLASHDAADTTSQRIAAVEKLESMGAEVLALQAQASDRSDMERVASEARKRFGEINGVFHVAGVGGGALVQLLSRDAAFSVLKPKVHGTLILDSLFPEVDLMVLFSSINAILPFTGTVDYTAANIFLDNFANATDSHTRKVLSINWDAWQEVGMAVASAKIATASSHDTGFLQFGIGSNDGIEAMRRALGANVPQVAVVTRDLLKRLEAARASTVYLGDRAVTHQTVPEAPALSQHARPEMDQSFVAPRDETERVIAGIWQELLGLERVGIDDNFFELGGHSLIATGLLTRIQRTLGAKLPLRTIFEASTVRTLAERVTAFRVTLATPVSDADKEGREEFEI